MKQWYESTLRIERAGDDGNLKAVPEKYLFEADSYTDAENRTISSIVAEGEMSIENITKKKFAEVHLCNSDLFFCATIEIITLDEKSGKEKKSTERLLINAVSFGDAYNHFKTLMDGTVVPYNLVSLSRTKILEVYTKD